MKSLEKRNHNIDYIKGIACLLVIFIHYPFWGMLGEYVKAVGRIAVPLFFMISGYFLYDINVLKIKKRICHIIKLTAEAYIFSVFMEIGLCFIREGNIIKWGAEYLQKKQLFDFLIWNVCSWADYLWFLPALLYCYVCWYFIKKLRLEKVTFFLGEMGLLLLLLVNYAQKFGIIVPMKYYRNWLFTGFPFMCLGFWVGCNKDAVRKIPLKILYAVLIVGCLFVLPERVLWGNCQVYLNTLLIVFSTFSIAQKDFRVDTHNKIVFIGRELSMLIYVLHWYVRYFFYKAETVFGLQFSLMWAYISPIGVAVISVIVAYGGYKIYLWREKLTK